MQNTTATNGRRGRPKGLREPEALTARHFVEEVGVSCQELSELSRSRVGVQTWTLGRPGIRKACSRARATRARARFQLDRETRVAKPCRKGFDKFWSLLDERIIAVRSRPILETSAPVDREFGPVEVPGFKPGGELLCLVGRGKAHKDLTESRRDRFTVLSRSEGKRTPEAHQMERRLLAHELEDEIKKVIGVDIHDNFIHGVSRHHNVRQVLA